MGHLLGQLIREDKALVSIQEPPSERLLAESDLRGGGGGTCRSRVSSGCRVGLVLYSAALEMISIKPRIFVLAFRDMLNNSVTPHRDTISHHAQINSILFRQEV